MHRGFGTLAPDNSLAALRMALESGVDGVNLDAQLSADGHVVVFHDLSVDRLTDGTGRVRDLTLAELKALVEKLRERRPDTPIIYMSGYTRDEVVRRGIFRSEVPFLEKPFSPAKLLSIVQDQLGRGTK